jgi:uncharacterized protein YecT (DUF1311 family)
MRGTIRFFCLASCLIGLPARADLDCHIARTDIERAICASPELMAVDRQMQQLYDRATSDASADRNELRHEQLSWLHSRDRRCSGDPLTSIGLKSPPEPAAWRNSCLIKAYSERLRAFGGGETGDPICHAIVQHMTDIGSVSKNGSPGTLEEWSKGFVKLDGGPAPAPDSPIHVAGLTMKSEFGGSLHCQTYTLTEMQAGAEQEIDPPPGFEGGEGSCPTGFHLAEIDKHGFLVSIIDNDFTFSRRSAASWSSPCTVTIYQHRELTLGNPADPDSTPGFCHRADCDALTSFAVKVAKIADSESGLAALWAARPAGDQDKKWDAMVHAAYQNRKSVNIPVMQKFPR